MTLYWIRAMFAVRPQLWGVRCVSSKNLLKLTERGMYKDIFPSDAVNEIKKHLVKKWPSCVYAGFDPTADSLHVGNLLVLMNLLHWQRAGHTVIALVGGATGYIGDPSGRESDRPLMQKAILDANIEGITNNIHVIFDNHRKYLWNEKTELQPLKLLNNYDFYKEMNAVDFVSKVGRHFRMGTMLLKQSVQTKLKSDCGMSFTEFTYQIFQAYDWLYLFQQYKCRFQLGGSDQMGNILAGHDLISRVEKEPVYGITLPLIKSREGDKFGKSSSNAVWLDPKKTSPYSLYQYFKRKKDSEVEELLKLFTFDTIGQIEDLMRRHNEKPELRLPQLRLAQQVTTLVHGEEGLKKAEATTAALYNQDITELMNLSAVDLEELFEGASLTTLAMEPGMDLLELAMKARCFPTESDAVRIMNAGGFHVNHQKAQKFDEVLTETTHILPNKLTLLRVGKKNYHIVRWNNL